MFILRRITSESNEINEIIGSTYHLILRERQPKEFKEALKEFSYPDDNEFMYGVILYWENNSHRIMPLYKKSHYFIMTESGKTFSNLTYK